MNQEVEYYIQKNCSWLKLPPNVKQVSFLSKQTQPCCVL